MSCDKSRTAHEGSHVVLLQTGHIFVYTGLLNIVQNDDQLAMVLAHEMAHALLNHAVTKPAFIYCIMIISLIIIPNVIRKQLLVSYICKCVRLNKTIFEPIFEDMSGQI